MWFASWWTTRARPKMSWISRVEPPGNGGSSRNISGAFFHCVLCLCVLCRKYVEQFPTNSPIIEGPRSKPILRQEPLASTQTDSLLWNSLRSTSMPHDPEGAFRAHRFSTGFHNSMGILHSFSTCRVIIPVA